MEHTRKDRHLALILATATFLVLAVFTHDRVFVAGNDASRFAQMEALVDQGSASIDGSRYAWTVDAVRIDGRTYSNKPPLLGVAGAGVYFVLQKLTGLSFAEDESWTLYLLTLILMGGAAAWLVARFYLALGGEIDPAIRLLATVALAVGTILFSFSVTLSNHGVAAALLFFAFLAARSGQGLQAGIWLSLVVCVDIVPGIVFVPVLGYILQGSAGRRGLGRYGAALAAGAVLFVAVNWLSFGSPLPPKMVPGAVDLSASLIPEEMSRSLNLPVRFLPDSWSYPLRCLFGWHGFLSVSPVLLLGIWGMVLAWKEEKPLPRSWTLALGAGMAVLTAGHVLWIGSLGGWSYGYRYPIPIIPILLFFLPAALVRLPRWITATVLAVSIGLALLGAYNPWPPGYEPDQEESSATAKVTNPVGANLAAWMVEYLPDLGLTQRAASAFLDPDERRQDQYLQAFYRSKNDEEMRIEHLRWVVRRHPDSAEAIYDLAATLAEMGRRDEAIVAYRETLELAPDVLTLRLEIGTLLLETGRHDEALGHFEHALKLDPSWVPALDAAARALVRRPDPRVEEGHRALSLAGRAAELTGFQDAGILDTMAAAHAALGQFQEAVGICEAILQALPRAPEGMSASAWDQLERFRGKVARDLEHYRRGERSPGGNHTVGGNG